MRYLQAFLDRFVPFAILAVVLLTSRGALHLSPLQEAVAPHRYNLVAWEVRHFMGKWWYKVRDVMPGGHRDREDRLADVREFFGLVVETNGQEVAVLRLASTPGRSAQEFAEAEARLAEMRARLRSLGTRVEEVLESELSSVLGRQGLKSRVGMVFPPVDFSFDRTPKLLITSLRDRIETRDNVLLQANMPVEAMEHVEAQILEKLGLSALVDDTGGVATYPSVLPPSYDLRTTLQIVAHEWLHQFFFFRPLGRAYHASPEMTTLNETAADMAGRELGDLAYEAITGQKPEPPGPPAPPGVFDFNREMRVTRLRTDELLAEGLIEEAEAYMEERRLVFVANGYYLRKLNQAYFAFHGTYAEAGASVSPIAAELAQLRARSQSVGDFVRRVARFSSYEAFKRELAQSAAPARQEAAGAIVVPLAATYGY